MVLANLSLRYPNKGRVLTTAKAFCMYDLVISLFFDFIYSVTLICLK
jgi:hypothetical protein